MKYLSSFCLSLIISMSSLTLHGETITWKGGIPGDETNWSNPRNWNKNIVPTEFNEVVIPNTSTRGNYYPVVNNHVNPIGSLLISGGAVLSITKEGFLVVDGSEVYNYGVMNLGTISIVGEVLIANCALEPYIGDDSRHACFVLNSPKACNQFQLVNTHAHQRSKYWAIGSRIYGSN